MNTIHRSADITAAQAFLNTMHDDLFGDSPFVQNSVRVAKDLGLVHTDQRRVKNLAVRLMAQGMHTRLCFPVGQMVMARQNMATVVSGKPMGFHERPRWNFHTHKPIIDPARDQDLTWVVYSGGSGIAQIMTKDCRSLTA